MEEMDLPKIVCRHGVPKEMLEIARGDDSVLANMRAVKKFSSMRSEDLKEELLPGIPNDITLNLITPKVPWRDLHRVSSVCHEFKKAIEGHLVYDAKVHASSTQTLAVVLLEELGSPGQSDRFQKLCLYSITDKFREALPPIPGVRSGIPVSCQYVSFKDKIYVLGGAPSGVQEECESSNVFMLDLAGTRQWKRCANMKEPRRWFGAGVKDGKIYVFGGISSGKTISACEVYDPTVDAWCNIAPMKYFPVRHQVAILEKELLVFGGYTYNSRTGGLSESGYILPEVYDLAKDEWRSIDERLSNNLFIAQGRVHLMGEDVISVYNFDTHPATILHSHSLAGLKGETCLARLVYDPLAVDSEILVYVLSILSEGRCQVSIVQSWGFGGDKKEMGWKEVIVLRGLPIDLRDRPFITIQL